MRKFYGVLAMIAVIELIFGSLVSFATPPSEYTAQQLAGHRDSWEISVLEESPIGFKKEDEDHIKSSLLDFIALSGSPTLSKIANFHIGVFIILVFCIIGYIREGRIKGRAVIRDLHS